MSPYSQSYKHFPHETNEKPGKNAKMNPQLRDRPGSVHSTSIFEIKSLEKYPHNKAGKKTGNRNGNKPGDYDASC